VFVGLSSVAVPLVTAAGSPASLAVIYLTQEVHVAHIADRLQSAAHRIAGAMQ
jgi:hypothetical protein